MHFFIGFWHVWVLKISVLISSFIWHKHQRSKKPKIRYICLCRKPSRKSQIYQFFLYSGAIKHNSKHEIIQNAIVSWKHIRLVYFSLLPGYNCCKNINLTRFCYFQEIIFLNQFCKRFCQLCKIFPSNVFLTTIPTSRGPISITQSNPFTCFMTCDFFSSWHSVCIYFSIVECNFSKS